MDDSFIGLFAQTILLILDKGERLGLRVRERFSSVGKCS